MATKSYSEYYLLDVSENLGAMFEYAVAYGYSPEVFWQYFINSIVAHQIENGNPRYLAGYSGREYVDLVINSCFAESFSNTEKQLDIEQSLTFDMYYWAGWAIAHLQHYTNYSFYQINNCLPISRVLELYYVLHESDISKFIDVAKTYLFKDNEDTNLKK